MNKITAAEALHIIHYEMKIDILSEGNKVYNLIRDFCPGEPRVARRIKTAYESGAVNLLAAGELDKQTLFSLACKKLTEYSEVSDIVAEETISYFYDALKWHHASAHSAEYTTAIPSAAHTAAMLAVAASSALIAAPASEPAAKHAIAQYAANNNLTRNHGIKELHLQNINNAIRQYAIHSIHSVGKTLYDSHSKAAL